MDETTERTGEVKTTQFMLYVEGEKTAYRCDCGANVFHREELLHEYICNGCGAFYKTEPPETVIQPGEVATMAGDGAR